MEVSLVSLAPVLKTNNYQIISSVTFFSFITERISIYLASLIIAGPSLNGSHELSICLLTRFFL